MSEYVRFNYRENSLIITIFNIYTPTRVYEWE